MTIPDPFLYMIVTPPYPTPGARTIPRRSKPELQFSEYESEITTSCAS